MKKLLQSLNIKHPKIAYKLLAISISLGVPQTIQPSNSQYLVFRVRGNITSELKEKGKKSPYYTPLSKLFQWSLTKKGLYYNLQKEKYHQYVNHSAAGDDRSKIVKRYKKALEKALNSEQAIQDANLKIVLGDIWASTSDAALAFQDYYDLDKEQEKESIAFKNGQVPNRRKDFIDIPMISIEERKLSKEMPQKGEKALVFTLHEAYHTPLYVSTASGKMWLGSNSAIRKIKVDPTIQKLDPLTKIFEYHASSGQLYYNIKESVYLAKSKLVKKGTNTNQQLQELYKNNRDALYTELRDIFKEVLKNDEKRKEYGWDIIVGEIGLGVEEQDLLFQEPYNSKKSSTNYYIPIYLEEIQLEKPEEQEEKKDFPVRDHGMQSQNNQQENNEEDSIANIEKLKQEMYNRIQENKILQEQISATDRMYKNEEEENQAHIQTLKEEVNNLKQQQSSTSNNDQVQTGKNDLASKLKGFQTTIKVVAILFVCVFFISHLFLSWKKNRKLLSSNSSESTQE